MEKFNLLLQGNRDWIIKRVLHYAKEHSYYKFLTGLHQPWIIAVDSLQNLITTSWNEYYPEDLELSLKDQPVNCQISKFINEEARKHRARGIGPGMFFGMLKYFRRSYLDLISSANFDGKYERLCFYFIARFFDRMEIALSSNWFENDTEVLEELQKTNREIVNEKIKYITIFESLPTPTILLNESYEIESINHSFTHTFPNPEKVCTWLAHELHAFKISHALFSTFEKAFVSKETTKYFEIQMKRMLDLKAKQTGVVIILNDITARIKSQQVLKENEELFRSYFENAAVGTALIAIDGNCIKVNNSLCQILGYSKQELQNINLKAITHPEDVNKSVDFMRELLFGYNKSGHLEKRYIHKSGSVVWAQLSCSIVMDFHDNPDYCVMQVKDITQQKEAELALKESLNKYLTLFNNVNDMIIMRELKDDGMPGVFIEVNDVACKKLGYTRDELLKINTYELMTEESVTLLKSRVHEYLNGGKIFCELSYRTKKGREIPFEFNSHAFYHNGKKLF